MKKSRSLVFAVLYSTLAFVGGVFKVYGDFDDSPGLVLLGFIMFFVSIIFVFKYIK